MITIEVGANDNFYDMWAYPAGETQVRLTERGIQGIQKIRGQRIVNVVARNLGAEKITEMELLIDALTHFNSVPVDLYLPYLPYSRADRRFQVGDCAGLEVFLRRLENMAVANVYTLDVHNPRSIENSVVKNILPTNFIRRSLNQLVMTNRPEWINVLLDKGSRKRYDIDSMVGCNVQAAKINILDIDKTRDQTNGELSGFKVPHHTAFKDGPTVIFDDICDGGGTFLGIARELWNQSIYNLHLRVTHGIFSKGIFDLGHYFHTIGCTDSMSGFGLDNVIRTPCVDDMLFHVKETL